MLKRHQVLLNDWLADFLKYRSDHLDISFSEAIRMAICIYYLIMLPKQHPEYELDFSADEISERIKEYLDHNSCEEEMSRNISKIYFEARKIMEYVTKKEASAK